MEKDGKYRYASAEEAFVDLRTDLVFDTFHPQQADSSVIHCPAGGASTLVLLAGGGWAFFSIARPINSVNGIVKVGNGEYCTYALSVVDGLGKAGKLDPEVVKAFKEEFYESDRKSAKENKLLRLQQEAESLGFDLVPRKRE